MADDNGEDHVDELLDLASERLNCDEVHSDNQAQMSQPLKWGSEARASGLSCVMNGGGTKELRSSMDSAGNGVSSPSRRMDGPVTTASFEHECSRASMGPSPA